MKNINISILGFAIATIFFMVGCQKEEFLFGDIKAPENMVMTVTVEGANAANPDGNGSGRIVINAKADGALTYRIDFGDGTVRMVPSGNIEYKYTTPGTKEYIVTVSAVGTGGIQSVMSKKSSVFVLFEIPEAIVTFLTNNASKKWASDNNAAGHFGVGPTNEFSPIWYSAGPNERDPCAYDDVITFFKEANGTISMELDNKGESFAIGAATGFYGFSGGDGCFPINPGGKKALKFFEALSGSTPNQSTRIEFEVPGNGLINFGTGGVSYEILAITATQLHVRSIGADGNAWFMKLKSI
jgi:hypothetical protein